MRPPTRLPIAPLRAGLSLATLVATAGCTVVNAYEDPALVGDWESDQPIANGERNELDADLDGKGDATVLYTPDGVYLHTDRYDLEWEQTDEDEFEITLDCSYSTLLGDGCGAHDFSMRCDARSDGDELRCESGHPYTDQSLQWQRQ